MTGLPGYNYERFNEVSALIRDAGYEVYNPAEYPFDGDLEDFPIRAAFAEYCHQICVECDVLILLEGWEGSKGANAELQIAKICGLEIVEWSAATAYGNA